MKIKINKLKEINPESPILIEGLPGIGMVGKLCLDHLKKEYDFEKYAEIESNLFAPQVDMNKDSEIVPRKNELLYLEREEEKDIILFRGRDQGTTAEAQHLLSQAIAKEAEELNTSFIYTLGGLGTKQLQKDPTVYGAVTDRKLKKKYKEHGVKFDRQGPIIGAAGLLLEYGKRKEIPGICLMGQTHGKFIDPNAAKNLLKVIEKDINLEIDYQDLDDKSEEMEKAVSKMIKQQTQAQQPPETPEADTQMEYIH
ncbi:MAG: proteasome assembly chaperone family protein [archaeon]